jgi:S-adenosylmethionine:tRNA ribosyltransferase-isomerase
MPAAGGVPGPDRLSRELWIARNGPAHESAADCEVPPYMLRTDDFDFALPEDLIASRPLEQRDASRMMVVDHARGTVEHRMFREFPSFTGAEDLVVFNNVRVARARFFSDDGRIELLRLQSVTPRHWQCMVRPGRKMRLGQSTQIGGATGTVTAVLETGIRCIEWDRAVDEERCGHLALPHYMKRDDDGMDTERYQTVYARQDRSDAIAAPTAGLHFTPEIVAALPHTHLTLHVGPGTFQPVKAELLTDHVMHSEHYSVSPEAAERIESAPRRIAVGTTVTRVLEHCALTHGRVTPHEGDTAIFIYPGFQFRRVDALLTNFHLPRSTLFMLVCALGGTDLLRRAYAEAVEQRYRFYSYGDCMLIL